MPSRGNLSVAEYLKWRNIELVLDGVEPNFESLRASIILEYEKGNKDVNNEESVKFFRLLNELKYHHMYSITLLIIHCLRHGLVRGLII